MLSESGLAIIPDVRGSPATVAMQLEINGNPVEAPDGQTVADLLVRFELSPPRVAVEVNETLVRRVEYAQTRLRPGDRVEIVTLVGGG